MGSIMAQGPSSISDIPRYGAATLGGGPIGTRSSINWGGVVKGALIVSSVALAGYGVYYVAANYLFAGAGAQAALGKIGTALNTVATGIGTWVTTDALPWITKTALPAIGEGLTIAATTVIGWIGSALNAIGISMPTGSALAAAAVPPSTAVNTAAIGAGAAATAMAASVALPAIKSTAFVHAAEHLTHHAAEKTVETGERTRAPAARPASNNGIWADKLRPNGPTTAGNFAAKVGADAAALNNALTQK